MRVLLINNFHYLRGGDCRYTFDLAKLLKNHGHEVMHFSMHHPKNIPYSHDRFFTSYIDYEELNKRKSMRSLYRVLTTSFWNREAQRNITALIREFKPDIAHLQNILHNITPSVIPILKKHKIPIAHHLHDYNLICPDTYLMRDGKICEECFGGKYYRCIIHRCKKGSLAASFAAATQRYLHDYINVFKSVSYFIAPSNFTKQKFLEADFAYANRIIYIPHFIDIKNVIPEYKFDQKRGVVFAGRLIEEKGIWTLIRAAELLLEVPIIIFGDGKLRTVLVNEIAKRRLANIQLRGWRPISEVLRVLKDSHSLVMPSIWYETTGLSILEAGAIGRATIVSDNTAMSEVVKHEKSGLVFSMGDANSLAECIKRICSDSYIAESLGRGARTRMENFYSAKLHYQKILKLYEQMIGEKS